MLRCDDPLPRRPRRILVAGVSGCGKTTLARRIAEITGGPHVEIDGLFHGSGWVPRQEFLDDVHHLVRGESWTTEWQYSAVRRLLAENADLLVWLDPPFWRTTMPRLLRRTVHRRWRRIELWNGNHEPPLWTVFRDSDHILRWAARTRRKYTSSIPALETDTPTLQFVRLASAGEVEQWLAGPLTHTHEP